MKEETILIRVGKREIPVRLLRKKVRGMTLRMTKDGGAVFTAPLMTSRSTAVQFLQQHVRWLAKHTGARSFFGLPEELRTGDRVLYLGREMPVQIESGSKALLTERDGVLVLKCRGASDPRKAADAFERELRRAAQDLFDSLLDKYYPVIASKHPRPEISVKKMTSRWGSATPAKGHISLNLYLMKAPVSCIESVVLHETAHFLQMNHGDAFYRVVTGITPDYWERHRQLTRLGKT